MATFLEQPGNVVQHAFVKTYQPDHFTNYDGYDFGGDVEGEIFKGCGLICRSSFKEVNQKESNSGH